MPQIFCAYKEVLALYRQGLRVPDDVTLVWPDDNFGYVRNFAGPAERARSGGLGVYYHISYLGRPLAYLWLTTTPPALIWEEMRKAHEHGADRLWILNVGDLKMAEPGTEFFLEMAWDIDRWRPDNLPAFLAEWSARQFGPDHATAIAAVLADYFRLNFARKPEHLQWWLPKEPYRPSDLTPTEIDARLAAFTDLRRRAEALRAALPSEQQDAFYQLIYYPAVGSALANERYFAGERGELDRARAADAQLAAETRFFNEQIAGGKWRGFMNLEPADTLWASMRIAPWAPPAEPEPQWTMYGPPVERLDAANKSAETPGADGARWTIIPGLGHSATALTVQPFTAASYTLETVRQAPRLDYEIELGFSTPHLLKLMLLPTHPLRGTALRLAVALDDQPPQLAALEVGDGGPGWAQGVLANRRTLTITLPAAARGRHTLRVWALDPGVVLDRITITPAE